MSDIESDEASTPTLASRCRPTASKSPPASRATTGTRSGVSSLSVAEYTSQSTNSVDLTTEGRAHGSPSVYGSRRGRSPTGRGRGRTSADTWIRRANTGASPNEFEWDNHWEAFSDEPTSGDDGRRPLDAPAERRSSRLAAKRRGTEDA
jgi:hypothetical protein